MIYEYTKLNLNKFKVLLWYPIRHTNFKTFTPLTPNLSNLLNRHRCTKIFVFHLSSLYWDIDVTFLDCYGTDVVRRIYSHPLHLNSSFSFNDFLLARCLRSFPLAVLRAKILQQLSRRLGTLIRGRIKKVERGIRRETGTRSGPRPLHLLIVFYFCPSSPPSTSWDTQYQSWNRKWDSTLQ